MSPFITFAELVELCARAAHAVNCIFVEAVGEPITIGPWEMLKEERKEGIRQGVRAALLNPDMEPGDSHKGWLATMEAAGWKYGPVRDEEAKVHPCMLPYDALPPEQRAKDAQFLTVVNAHAHALMEAGKANPEHILGE